MKAHELREKNVNELNDELRSLLREQFNLRMLKSSQEMTATHEFKKVRRSIARVKTVLAEKVGK